MAIYTDNERTYLSRIRQRVDSLRAFLNSREPDSNRDLDEWFRYIAKMRAIQGNMSNDFSFLACLLAKRYLASRFELGDYDAAAKPQGAPGLDIDIPLADGKRLIAEIKTTVPYSGASGDLGAQQKASFNKDFAKLNAEMADYKFFFVTSTATFEIVKRRYMALIPGVEVILLTDSEA